jgi:hypothetical protein
VKLVKTELVMFSVGAAFEPPTAIFPPVLENTRLLLFAHDAKGKASASKAVRTTRFMETPPGTCLSLVEGDLRLCFLFYWTHINVQLCSAPRLPKIISSLGPLDSLGYRRPAMPGIYSGCKGVHTR